jgi:bifunctional NMN adenylyltransferase/nudix hydrolase
MKEKEYQVAVFIGRFQPFHNEHYAVLKKALEIADKVLIIVGSYRVAPNIQNPLTYEERVEMISSLLSDKTVFKSEYGDQAETTVERGDIHRVEFIPVRDHYYNDNLWVSEVQQKTAQYINPGDSVAIVGAYKDSSSYYLNLFPQWDFVTVKQERFLNSTDIRNAMYKRTKPLGIYNPYHPNNAHDSVEDWGFLADVPSKLAGWLTYKYMKTERYHNHVLEYNHLQEYKKKWEAAPFPPTFVTVDSVVICSGHVLVVKRKFEPGKGLYALPGGFIKQNETLVDAAIRELKEETAIDVQKVVLKNNVTDSKVFDYPSRSLRGRTITHAYKIKLKDGELPRIVASSDADKVQWMALADVYLNEDKFFEDHFHIIQYFITRS